MTDTPHRRPEERQQDAMRWRALAFCLVAAAMTLLDVSIVNVALSSIRQRLHADDSDIQWVIAGVGLLTLASAARGAA